MNFFKWQVIVEPEYFKGFWRKHFMLIEQDGWRWYGPIGIARRQP